jgi:hypothetical protein
MENWNKFFKTNNALLMADKRLKGFESMENIFNVNKLINSFNINKSAMDSILKNPAFIEANKQEKLMKTILGGGSMSNFLTGFDTIKKQNNIMDALGGHTLTHIINGFQTPYERKDTLSAWGALNNIHNAVTTNLNTYNEQLNLSKQLAKTFNAYIPPKSLVFDVFTSDNFVYKDKKLNAFDVLSGASFLNTLNRHNQDDKLVNQIYDQAQSVLISNAALQEEITKLHATIITMQEGSNVVSEETWYKIKDIKDYVEWFMNKILIRKFGISPAVAYAIVFVVVLTLIPLIREIIIEAKGSNIYNSITGSEEKSKVDTVTIIKYIQKPNEITDFTIDKTPLYLRSSNKTKCIGYIDPNSTISIIKMKNGWCLVEALVTVTKPNTNKNRKKYEAKNNLLEIQNTIKGWVEKKHLDMFQ